MGAAAAHWTRSVTVLFLPMWKDEEEPRILAFGVLPWRYEAKQKPDLRALNGQIILLLARLARKYSMFSLVDGLMTITLDRDWSY